jgi:acetate kinase
MPQKSALAEYANAGGGPMISESSISVSILALQTNEEYVIAQHTRTLV